MVRTSMIVRTQYRIAAVLVIAVVLAGAAGTGFAADAAPATHTVLIDGTRFEPETLTVRAGDTVIWINNDPFPHTATAVAGAFDSESIAPNKSWEYTTKRAGVFPYSCTLHKTMKGTLHVE